MGLPSAQRHREPLCPQSKPGACGPDSLAHCTHWHPAADEARFAARMQHDGDGGARRRWLHGLRLRVFRGESGRVWEQLRTCWRGLYGRAGEARCVGHARGSCAAGHVLGRLQSSPAAPRASQRRAAPLPRCHAPVRQVIPALSPACPPVNDSVTPASVSSIPPAHTCKARAVRWGCAWRVPCRLVCAHCLLVWVGTVVNASHVLAPTPTHNLLPPTNSSHPQPVPPTTSSHSQPPPTHDLLPPTTSSHPNTLAESAGGPGRPARQPQPHRAVHRDAEAHHRPPGLQGSAGGH